MSSTRPTTAARGTHAPLRPNDSQDLTLTQSALEGIADLLADVCNPDSEPTRSLRANDITCLLYALQALTRYLAVVVESSEPTADPESPHE